MEHHPVLEEIVDVICKKTQNTDRSFFRAEVAFYLGKIAGCMRATILTKDRGEIPVNIYTIALAESGYGKGHSVNIMENDFIKGFKDRFINNIMPITSSENMWKLANKHAAINSTEPEDEYAKLEGAYNRAGEYPFTFDSGTAPAVKQLRDKLLLADSGSINLTIDEIGANLVGNTEVLNVYLELYDQGYVKQKLTKNTAENIRNKELDGRTPANMMLFGTPSALMDGGAIEDQFFDFLEMGYARRCLFGFGRKETKAYHVQDAKEIYHNLVDPKNDEIIGRISDLFTSLAHMDYFRWGMDVEEDVAIKLIEYRIICEAASDALPTHEAIKKAEISHRYARALKLAGAYAFVDKSPEITMDHLMSAILLVEESGKAFEKVLYREKPYVKLAKYISEVGTEVTHADLDQALPYYKSGIAFRKEIHTLATAWGYKNNILIKRNLVDGIEFFSATSLEEVDLDNLTVSYSSSFAYDYQADKAPFDQLGVLLTAKNMNWCSHAFKNEHRTEENAIAGFDLAVFDVDGTADINLVRELLKDYKHIIQTTKRHTDEEHRFRLIFPMNYRLELDAEDYVEFMDNFASWLPFDVDTQANQRSRKWLSNEKADVYINNGENTELIDVLKFIPKTSKHDEYTAYSEQISDLDSLERWFLERIKKGQRNQGLVRYAFALVDSGHSLTSVSEKVHSLNNNLKDPLPKDEIDNTIMRSVAKKLQDKEG